VGFGVGFAAGLAVGFAVAFAAHVSTIAQFNRPLWYCLGKSLAELELLNQNSPTTNSQMSPSFIPGKCSQLLPQVCFLHSSSISDTVAKGIVPE
jgi:hypothetical protein